MTKWKLGAMAAVGVGLAASAASAAVISNPWSELAGDRANYSAFTFKATAGTFPASVTPAGAIDSVQTFGLDALTFTRPANDVANGVNDPLVSTTSAGGLTTFSTPVFLDVYTTRTGTTGLAFTGFLGSSTNSFFWEDLDGNEQIAPGADYTYNFNGITLDKDLEYWFVFSETSGDGDVANFRTRVNTSGTDATPGPGAGYLTNNVNQVVGPTASNFNWGVEYDAAVTPIPEPASLTLLGVGGLAMIRRRRCRS